jgi:anti-sigma B factor antagonist
MSAVLEASTEEKGQVCVIRFLGRMDANTSKEGEEAIQQAIQQGRKQVVLDLGGLAYISSSGLRVLLAALKQLRQGGGDLRLASLRPNIRDVVNMTGFNRIFSIFEDESAAIDSYRT